MSYYPYNDDTDGYGHRRMYAVRPNTLAPLQFQQTEYLQPQGPPSERLMPHINRRQPSHPAPRIINRAPSEVVDLTGPSPTRPTADNLLNPSISRPSSAASSGRQTRRHTSFSPRDIPRDTPVIDLDDDDDSAGELTEDSLPLPPPKPQGEPQSTKLSHFNCSICLDEPQDLAATPCGHLYCDRCLREALHAGQTDNNSKIGRCPLCRGKINVSQIITLEVKMRKRENNSS